MITITRKIQIGFDVADKSELKALYEKWYKWQHIVHRAANWIATHHYIQDNVKDLFYFTEDVKVKLGNVSKDADGILTMSRDNTTYQVLSKAFKGECPMGMLSGLNMVVASTFKKESKDVRYGKKSLRTYRGNIPMPCRRGDMANFEKLPDGNYRFHVYGTWFKTWFGKDLSGNEQIMDMAMSGEYKLCDSSIKIDGNKIFLLAVFQFEKQEVALDADKQCLAHLDLVTPIVAVIGKKRLEIGSSEEFLHRRRRIQFSLRRVQKAARFNKGGHGREKKLEAIQRFRKAEDNYVDTRIHQYTRKLVDLCVKFRCGELVLVNQKDKEDKAKENKEYILRNWTYFGMKEKLAYKCDKVGIKLTVQ